MTFRLRLIIEWFIIAFLANAVVITFLQWDITASFDNLLYDGLSETARPPADDDILIVAIDDASLKEFGKWPWARDQHAQVINNIKKLEPRSISLDIILSETGEPEGDKALSEALYGDPLNPEETPSNGPAIFLPLHFVTPGNDGRAFDTILPASPFLDPKMGQKNLGHVNLTFDSDGILRKNNICFQASEETPRWPHLMERIYQNRHGKASPAMEKAVKKPFCEAPVLIPFSESGSISTISYSEAANGTMLADSVRGKDVIIGATAAGLGDNYPTPSSNGSLIPGVEIIANMLGALERDDFITPLSLWQSILISLLPIWILLIGFLRWQPRQILMASGVIFLGLLILSATLLYFGFWFPPGPALAALFLAYPLWGWRRLQAMSYYMGRKLRELESEEDSSPLGLIQKKSIDLVGKQRDTLDQAIDNIRDLRRFVTDTLSGLPDPMFVINMDNEVILSNDILNQRIDSNLVGGDLSNAIETMVRKEDKPSVWQYIEASDIESADVIIDQEEIVRMVDNYSSSYVRFTSPRGRNFVMRRVPLLSNEGEYRGYIHYLADITALARADSQREEMLQLLSHDMRAPQSAILALLDGKIDEHAKQSIANNSKRTLQLAQDFVEIARMGETPFDGEELLIDSLVEEVIDSLWPLANERGIKIDLSNISEGSFIIGEADSLSRAFMNLLDNAIKFSPDNSNIAVKIKNMEFGKTTMVSITIEDQGDGIDSDMLPILFEKFTTNRGNEGRAQGTGLGLSFVSAVIERHHGSISADNKRDGGAIFSILIPESIEGES